MFHVRLMFSLSIRNYRIPERFHGKCPLNKIGVRYCSTKDKLLHNLQPEKIGAETKVTVVGIGSVGMACAYSIISRNLCSHLCLIDYNEKKLQGEMQDIQHGSLYLKGMQITSSTNYEASKNSQLVVIAAGVRQKIGESRLNLTQRNVKSMKMMVPPLAKYSPNAIFMVVSNPVDVMSYVTWKLSGFPRTQVIGSGTNLDSSRFRVLLSQRLGISPDSCHGEIIGEHGDSSVAVWSGVNVCGVNFKTLNPKFGEPDDPEKWYDLHRQVKESAYRVIELKGYTSWAIGLCVRGIYCGIFSNMSVAMPISTMVQGFYGITQECYMSLPVILGAKGVKDVVKIPLTKSETDALHKSAGIMLETQKQLDL